MESKRNGFNWISVGEGSTEICTSLNGRNWTEVNDGTNLLTTYKSVKWFQNRFFITGYAVAASNNPVIIIVSEDQYGQKWKALKRNSENVNSSINAISCNFRRENLITFTQNSIANNATIFTQPFILFGGVLITTDPTDTPISLYCIKNSVMYTSGIQILLSTSCNAITWNGTMWVAGGRGISNTMAYSYDGILWVGVGKEIFSHSCNAVAWN